MSRVIVANDPGHDFTKAREFGEVIALTKGNQVDVFNPERLLRQLDASLGDFDPVRDYVIFAGSILACAMLACVLKDRLGAMPLKLLVFDAKTRGYTERICSLDVRGTS